MIKTVIKEIKIKLEKNDDKAEKEWVNKTVNLEKLVSSNYPNWLRKINSIRTFFTDHKGPLKYQYCVKLLAGK